MAPSIDDAIFYSMLVIGPLGLFTNGVLLVAILKNKTVRKKDYTIFIINRGYLDIALCLQYVVLQPFGLTYPDTCAPISGVAVGTLLAIYLSEPILACNRYVAICHSQYMYKKIYSRRTIIWICVLVWVIGAIGTTINGFLGGLGKTGGVYCLVTFERKDVLVLLLDDYMIFFFSYLAMGFCYYKIFRFLQKHKTQAANLAQQSQLQEDKYLLRYIGSVALLPVLTELPLAATAIFHIYDSAWIPDFGIFPTTILFMLCPVINPIVTIYVIRPIREQIGNLCRSMIGKSNTSPVVDLQLSAATVPAYTI